MTQEQFSEFRPIAENLILRYQIICYSSELRKLVESQARQLLADYAPGSPFEKQLDMLPCDVVLHSAVDSYNTLLESQRGAGTDKTD